MVGLRLFALCLMGSALSFPQTESPIIVDTHDDTTQNLLSPHFDLGERHATGSIDIPRMREGGLGAIFFSIWISGTVTGPRAVKDALVQIDAVR